MDIPDHYQFEFDNARDSHPWVDTRGLRYTGEQFISGDILLKFAPRKGFSQDIKDYQ